jgi:metallo-beta-lactamase family protein
MGIKLKFYGAARTVTGSMHLIEFNNYKILLDCGLYQGKREESYNINKNFPFDTADINAVFLSHAHTDHAGNLPTLVKYGFKGDIYSTPATRDLCAIMLADSAHIQKKDIEYVNKKRLDSGLKPFKTLYDYKDVVSTLKLFKAIPYYRKFYPSIFNGLLEAEFIDAGHILGSSMIKLNIRENGKLFRFGFTGDIGRPSMPILRDPDFIGDVDFLISESTYGGKYHVSSENTEADFLGVLNESISRGGKIIVPAFSLGRTQDIVYRISKYFEEKKLIPFPIYIDSPLSADISDIYRLHPECYDNELAELITRGVDVLGLRYVTYIRSVEDSKKLNNARGPVMIISASGMCESGRVLHHLKNSITDPKNTIMIVGYQAVNTLGRKLVDSMNSNDTEVKIFGDTYRVRAKIHVLNSFSAHSDHAELISYFSNYKKFKPKSVFLVHGETENQILLKSSLSEIGFNNIEIPERGNLYILNV